ncbi:MAG: hypothetical protein R3343_12580 [Nitriliruptorales bacterium]|nr:hypothetical protein [Nitriliruptorales bacterium]
MGFVTNDKRGGGGEEGGGSGPSVELDLDNRVCATCRRELLPWQETCPDDGGEAVKPGELPPPEDPLAERLAAMMDDGDQSDSEQVDDDQSDDEGSR